MMTKEDIKKLPIPIGDHFWLISATTKMIVCHFEYKFCSEMIQKVIQFFIFKDFPIKKKTNLL
jgi:hypothetical protein